jgi:hypothetical protein
MGKFLVERNESHQEILLLLDDVQMQLRVMDHKINMLTDKVVGLDFSNLDLPQPQGPPPMENTSLTNLISHALCVSFFFFQFQGYGGIFPTSC